MAQDDSKYTKPGLRKRIFAQVKAGSSGGKPGQWSARKAQMVAQKYKAQGGGYKGGKGKKQKDLKRWGKEKWMTKKEKLDKCNFVVSYIGKNEPKFEMNNPHYMREVSRSHSDSIPPVILNKEPIQNRF